jgi:hypothetical protein
MEMPAVPGVEAIGNDILRLAVGLEADDGIDVRLGALGECWRGDARILFAQA